MAPVIFLLGSIILVQMCQLSGEQGEGRWGEAGLQWGEASIADLWFNQQWPGSQGHMIQNMANHVEGTACGSFAQKWTLGWAGTWHLRFFSIIIK